MFETEPKQAELPLASVVMTVYNGMPYVRAAVDSILSQDYGNWELIIVDDGSTDSTPEYLEQISENNVKIVRQENAGQHIAASLGINLAEGKYIARMDADDIAAPNRLSKQVSFLETHPQVVLVGSQFKRMTDDTTSGLPSTLPCNPEDIHRDLLKNHHAICNATTMFQRNLFYKLGGYWEHDIAEDWDFYLKAAETGDLANIDEVLLDVRIHAQSINGRRMLEAQAFNEYACELARRRAKKLPSITIEEFRNSDPRFRFPRKYAFQLDCTSISLYRKAVVNFQSGGLPLAVCQLMLAICCSPGRTVSRFVRFFRHKSSAAEVFLDGRRAR